MKKLLIILMFAVSLIGTANAQNDTTMYIADQPGYTYVCSNRFDHVIIYGIENCNDFYWINGDYQFDNPIIINSQANTGYDITYVGCGFEWGFHLEFRGINNLPGSSIRTIWKHQNENLTIEPVGTDSLSWFSYQWNTGETTPTINVTGPGTYICELIEMCGSVTRTFVVKDNVEIELATCDLVTNLNMVTWQTTPAQAQYIDHIIVKRDGLNVGTANYSEGSFLDDIGSDLAQRTYTLTAVATDGTECPIVSYPKETIHMAYLTGVNNTIEVNWNTPTGYDLLGYNICEWTPNGKDGDLRVIDFVGASVTSYTCQASQFTSGYVIIQGVEATKPESRLLSNRSSETVGVCEYGMDGFKVYPNPSNGAITVEGALNLTIFNTLGQVIATSFDEDGTHTFSLRSGIYFVKSGEGTVKKVMVE